MSAQDYFVNVVNQAPIPVTLGSENITITGSVNVGSTVEVVSSPENPVHVHVTEIPTDISTADSNYYMNVARGLIAGHYCVSRSGYLPDSTQNVETSVWVEGGIYPHGTWTSAQKLYVISTSASDTAKTVYIEGLDSNYNYQTEVVTTNGITAVQTTKNFIRIWTATITSASNNSANAGEITFRLGSGTGTVVAHIGAGLGITKLSQFTVPAGYTAYIQYGDCTTYHSGTGNVGALLKMMVRPFGGSFVCGFIAEVAGGNPYRNDFTVPTKVTEKTDIDVRLTVDTSNTKASCNWQVILIPNT